MIGILFSEYRSDLAGVAVFDLQEAKQIFSSTWSNPRISQWYSREGEYFFTEAMYNDTTREWHENIEEIHVFSFVKNKFIVKKINRETIKKAHKITYNFDPKKRYQVIYDPHQKRLLRHTGHSQERHRRPDQAGLPCSGQKAPSRYEPGEPQGGRGKVQGTLGSLRGADGQAEAGQLRPVRPRRGGSQLRPGRLRLRPGLHPRR